MASTKSRSAVEIAEGSSRGWKQGWRVTTTLTGGISIVAPLGPPLSRDLRDSLWRGLHLKCGAHPFGRHGCQAWQSLFAEWGSDVAATDSLRSRRAHLVGELGIHGSVRPLRQRVMRRGGSSATVAGARRRQRWSRAALLTQYMLSWLWEELWPGRFDTILLVSREPYAMQQCYGPFDLARTHPSPSWRIQPHVVTTSLAREVSVFG